MYSAVALTCIATLGSYIAPAALAAHKSNRKEIISIKLGAFQPMNR